MAEQLDKEVLKNLEMQHLLQLGIDEIPELEEFELLPAGVYLFDVEPAEYNSEADEANKHYINVTLKVAAIVELKDPTQAEVVKVGESKLAQRYYGSYGVQRFVTCFKGVTDVLKAQGEDVTVVSLMEQIAGRQIQAIVTHRVLKLTKEQKEAGEAAKVFAEVDPFTVTLVG